MTDTGCRYELFCRDDVPGHAARHQATLVDRLEGLADRVTVTAWPRRVRRWSDGDVLDRYDEFASWADDEGVDLSPFFGSRGAYYFEDGRQFDALVLPVCCLAVYDDGDLAAVYPHSADDAHYSVEDGLDAIQSSGTPRGQVDAEAAD